MPIQEDVEKPKPPKVESKTRKRVQSEDEGLRLLGRHVYEIKQQFKEEAEELYRNKVLIKRERTRDLIPHINRPSTKRVQKQLE